MKQFADFTNKLGKQFPFAKQMKVARVLDGIVRLTDGDIYTEQAQDLIEQLCKVIQDGIYKEANQRADLYDSLTAQRLFTDFVERELKSRMLREHKTDMENVPY